MTTTPLPSSYGWGKVIGRVVHAVADTAADADAYPEARPATGKVIFTPAKSMRKITDEDYPAFVLHEEVTADLNEAGILVDSSGRPGIWLIEGTWTVKFVIDKAQIPGFEIEVTRDFTDTAPLDLVMAAPPMPPPTATVVTVIVPAGGLPGQTLTPTAPGSTTLEWADVDGTGIGVSDHGALSGLTDDDHKQYALSDGTRGDFAPPIHGHTLADISDYTAPDLSGLVQTTDPRLSDARTPTAHNHDDRYYTEAEVDTLISGIISDGGGVSDHGALTGLTDDDHPQYALADGTRGNFASTSHGHTIANVTGLQAALDGKQAAGSYAPALGPNDNYVTTAEKAALHSHANKSALDSVSGVNTGDQDLSGYATTTALATGLAGKADATHSHDDRYYTEAEADGRFVTSDVGITKIWAGTQAAYDALTKDPTTLYVITED